MLWIFYINQKDKITEITLPNVNNKRIILDLSSVCPNTMLEAEIIDNLWKIIAPENMKMKANGEFVKSIGISDNMVINFYPENNNAFAVVVKEIYSEENTYKKYAILNGKRILVGRNDDNDIIFHDDFVGSHHFEIIMSDGSCYITDSSTNGTYLNGERITEKTKLENFDQIYIVGHKMFYINGLLIVNTNDDVISNIPEADLTLFVNENIYKDNSFFSRAPRRIEPVDTEEVKIDDPPAKNKSRPQPLIFIIGPSVTMPIPILISVLVNITSNASNGKSISMYLGTILSVGLSAFIGAGWALAHYFYNKRQMKKDDEERTKAYKAYIERNRELLSEKESKNKSILEKNYLSTKVLMNKAEDSRYIFWNRNIYQSDFLTVRIGRGKMKNPGQIIVSGQKFSMSNDELCELPLELYDKYKMIDNCAYIISLFNQKIIGIVGNKDKLSPVVNNIICQIAALHCYTDVKIGFLGERGDYTKYSYVRWFPHSFIDGSDSRMVSFDENTAHDVIYEIAFILRNRAESAEENKEKQMLIPHIILFCTSADIIRNSFLRGYMSSPVYLGITFVLIYERMNMLPNECKSIIEYTDDFSGYYMLDQKITEENNVDFELVSSEEAEKFARKISGFYVNEVTGGGIPASVDFFEMIGIGRIEQWDLIKAYKMNHSFEGMRSFLGLSSGGNPVYLDIHEKKDGPHGLVAGTTGSGKSETIQSFVLSLAMNYSPDDVGFVLIDYKGGGMANVFSGLPHVAGMITNLSDESGGELDRSLTRRACSSLRSEIKRRQSIFAQYKLNNIDTYQKLYTEGKADEPIPHLIIISDEFAELKKEQPEFIKELISVARVGRSLGIHLILATQKPSGVVDDEIWSNSRFRICLRVQDKQDSNGMIKRPDAAYITETGRAFLQVGNDERFEEFQSGYSGGEYVPKESFVNAGDNEAVIIGIDGSLAVVEDKRKSNSDSPTELDAAVRYINAMCKLNGINNVRSLWLAPLERNIFLNDIDTVANEGTLEVVYGVADNVEQQSRCLCSIDLYNISNLKICGTTGCGKTTMLQTLLTSAVSKYSPENLNFYIMDFSSRTFKLFKNLPHCGGVVYEEETEAVERLMKLMSDIIYERKKLFEKHDIGSFKEYIKLNTLCEVILAIDNFGAFLELYPSMEDKIIKLLHDGVRYGVQIILTVNNSSEIKYKMRSYILNSIMLRMNEKSDYSEIIGKNPEFVPSPVNGRGLVVIDKSILEYQAALPCKGSNEFERAEMLRKMFVQISENYKGITARKIPFISQDIKYSEILLSSDYSDRLLIGTNFETIEPYSVQFSSFYCYCVSFNDVISEKLIFNNILEYSSHYNVDIKIIRLNDELNLSLTDNIEEYRGIDGIGEVIKYLHGEFTERNKAVTEWKAIKTGVTRDRFMADKFGRVFIIIDDMIKFTELVHGPEGKNYAELMDMFIKQGKNHGIHIFGGYSSEKKTYLSVSNSFKSENHGIHFGGHTDNQNVLEIDLPIRQKAKETDYNIGIIPENGKPVFVHVPQGEDFRK